VTWSSNGPTWTPSSTSLLVNAEALQAVYADMRRLFTPAPPELRSKIYPLADCVKSRKYQSRCNLLTRRFLRHSGCRMGNGAEVGYGTSENAVKTQIWIALSVYVTRGDRQKAAPPGRVALHIDAGSFGDNIRKIPIQTALSSETSKCDTAIENTN
jgi:hypothetical protein